MNTQNPNYLQQSENTFVTVYGNKADMVRLRAIFNNTTETFNLVEKCQDILGFDNITAIERQLAARLLSLPTRCGLSIEEIPAFISHKYDENTMDHITVWSYEDNEPAIDATTQAITADALTLYLEEQLLSEYFHDFDSTTMPSSEVIPVILARMEMGAQVEAQYPQGRDESRETWLNNIGNARRNGREYTDKVAHTVNKWLTDNNIHHNTHHIIARKQSPLGGISTLEFKALRHADA